MRVMKIEERMIENKRMREREWSSWTEREK